MSAYSAAVLADSPLLYWQFDETTGTAAADSSGNSHGGTYTGGFTLGGTSLIPADTAGHSVALNGTSGQITSSFNPFTGQRTFETWINRTNHSTTDDIFCTSTGNVEFRLINQGDVQWFPNTSDVVTSWVSAYPGDGLSTHVVLTHDATAKQAQLFINGVALTAKATAVYNASPGNIAFGGAAQFFIGSGDDFAIYSGLLSSTRVLAHYLAGITSPARAFRMSQAVNRAASY